MFCLFYQGFVLPQDSTETSEFHSLKSQITPRSVTKETNQKIKTINNKMVSWFPVLIKKKNTDTIKVNRYLQKNPY